MNKHCGSTDDQLQDSKRGMAILLTCLVQELEAHQEGITQRFLDRLGRAYAEVRHDDTPALDRLELIDWTRELLSGFSQIQGQGRPFLDGV